MKINFLLLLTLSTFFFSCSDSKRKELNCSTFEELIDPNLDSIQGWDNVPRGFYSSWVSIDEKFPKHEVPQITKKNTVELTGWKNETVSAQLLIWTTDSISQIEVEFGEFKSKNTQLPATIAQSRFVRYVMTDIFEPGCGYRKPEDFPASLAPDMLDNIECMNIPSMSVRPIWITIQIPSDANAGEYLGSLKIYARNQKTEIYNIILNIQDRELPPANQWTFHLDLWQHPAAVARAENLPLWSDEHFEAMKPLMKMLADAGQKVITTTINKDPWHNQCYDSYADMIWWTKNTDGTWTYDYTIFDKWVNFMMEIGIDKMINCYSLVPWNNEIHYIDAKTNDTINVKADPGTEISRELWEPFLTDFTKHLKENNWLEIANIAMDERSPKEMQATLKLLKEIAPELGISLADNHKSYKEYPYIKDMSVSANAKVDEADILYRREHGYITTYYVCCSDKFPNVFTFSDSPDAVYCAWYTTAAGYDGLLRWAYNSWVENPVTDSRFRTWPAGDTYIVYPEGRSSIRFERLKEGIQDMEKVRILRSELASDSIKLAQLNSTIEQFNTITPEGSVATLLNNAKAFVNELSEN